MRRPKSDSIQTDKNIYRIKKRFLQLLLVSNWGLFIFALFYVGFMLFSVYASSMPFGADAERHGFFWLGAVGTLVFGGLSGYGFWTYKYAKAYGIQLDDRGIYPCFSTQGQTSLAWGDIRSMRDCWQFWQTIRLFDATSTRMLSVEYQIEQFDQVFQEIWKHVSPNLTLHEKFYSPISYFWGIGLLAGTILFIGGGGYCLALHQFFWGGLCVFIAVVSCVQIFLNGPHTLVIHAKSITLSIFWFSKTYAFHAITAIEARQTNAGQGRRRFKVYLELSEGRPKTFVMWGCNTFEIVRSLEYQLKRYGEARALA